VAAAAIKPLHGNRRNHQGIRGVTMHQQIYQQSIAYFLQPVAMLMDDPNVSEIMINGPDEIWVERNGKLMHSDACFPDEELLLAAVRNIAEYNLRQLDSKHPTLDGHLPDGSRIHVVLPPASRTGITLTIRRFRKARHRLADLIEANALSTMAEEFLRIAVEMHRNIMISGGTGTGKTTLLNALAAEIPRQERIVVIEDTAELQLPDSCHVVAMEAQPGNANGDPPLTIRELFANSLRMRPDRIIIGEVRRGEALDLVQSMLSGHAGALATIHANTPRDALTRLETLCLMSDTEIPVYVARQQVASAIQLVVQLARDADGNRRVTAISECLGLNHDSGTTPYLWNELFRFHAQGRDVDGQPVGGLVPTGNLSVFAEDIAAHGKSHLIQRSRPVFETLP